MKKLNKIFIFALIISICTTFCCNNYAFATEENEFGTVIEEETTDNAETNDTVTEDYEEEIYYPETDTSDNESTEENNNSSNNIQNSSETNNSNTINQNNNYYDQSYNNYSNNYNDINNNSNEVVLSEADLNTDLKSLTVSKGTLSPKFDSTKYKYTLYFDDKSQIKDLEVTYEANSSYSEIDHKKGEDNFYVYLENNKGDYSLYNVNYHVLQDDEILIDNNLYKISTFKSKTDIPKGFVIKDMKVDTFTIKVLESKDALIKIIQFENANNKKNTKWYYATDNIKELKPCELVTISKTKYIVVPNEKGIIYGVGKDGAGYYKYDKKTNKTTEFLGSDLVKFKKDKKMHKIIVTVSIVLASFILVLTILILVLFKRKKKGSENRPYLSIED